MTFGNYSDSVPKENLCIKINNLTLSRVENVKYLGINFDYNMRWDNHINYLIKKTKYLTFIFYKLSYMRMETLLMIYHAFFHGIISYGIIAWGGAYNNSITLLQNLQNRILKIVNKNNFIANNPMNIKQIFYFEALKYNYNDLKLKYINSTSRTRNKIINLPKIEKSVMKKHSLFNAIKLFNILPNELKILDLNKKRSIDLIKEWIKNNA